MQSVHMGHAFLAIVYHVWRAYMPRIAEFIRLNKTKECLQMTMYVQAASPVPFGAVFSLTVVNFIDRTVANLVEWNAARKTANALHELSTSQLEDIGLLPGDIKSAAYFMAHR